MPHNPTTSDSITGDFHYSFRIAKSRIQHGFLLAAVLAAIGLAALFLADPAVTGGPLVGLFNLCLAAGVAFYNWRLVRDPQPRLLIDAQGIWFRDWALDPIPWAQVADTLQQGGRIQAFFCIRLRDAEALLAALPQDRRAAVARNRLIRPPLLMIPAHSVEADFPTLRAAIEEGLQQSRA